MEIEDEERQIVECAQRFAPRSQVQGAQRVGSGHIHATYRVSLAPGSGSAGGGRSALLLQRLNEEIFPDLEALQRNVVQITDALRARPDRRRSDDGPDRVLEVLCDGDGASLVRAEDGQAWRAFEFLEGTTAIDVAEDAGQVYAAALAFGDFALGVSELGPDDLVEVIPNFHDTPGRFEALVDAAARDECERAQASHRDFEQLRRVWSEVREIFESRGGGELPRRVVHNDCKLNNALFDEEGRRVRCVVDLDTAWAGTLLFDLGELLRTTASRSPEDEPRPEQIRVEGRRIEAAARGFMDGLRRPADELELGVLPLSGALMALENAARFLTDHLQGDHYFPAQRADHNLERARAQLALAEHLVAAEAEIRASLRA